MMEAQLPMKRESVLDLEVDLNSPAVRSKLACGSCRANKVRCIRTLGSDSTCTRCARYGIECSAPSIQKRRGRPPKSLERNSAENVSISPVNDQKTNSMNPQRPSLEMMVQGPSSSSILTGHSNSYQGARNSDTSPSSLMLQQQNLQQTLHQPQSQSLPQQQHTLTVSENRQPFYAAGPSTSSFIYPSSQQNTHSMDQPYLHAPRASQSQVVGPSPDSAVTSSTPRSANNNLDLSEYLDPADKVVPKLPFYNNNPTLGKQQAQNWADEDAVASGRISDGEDPVSLLLLSVVEAHALVQLFHERLNPHVAVLDPHLHSMKFLRRSSTVLFSSVLAATSRFFRKDLHHRLLAHSQTILDRALTSGASDIGIVQSLMVLTYWKSPADTSAWRKIGMAIRIGYQSFWHIPRTEPLPEDMIAARHILNAERTWYCLFCFDRGLSQTFGLPTAIRLTEIGDPEVWARQNAHLGPSVDMHLAVSIQLCKLKDHWRSIFDTGTPSPAYVESAIDTMQAQCSALLAKWFTKGSPPPNFDAEQEHVIIWCIVDFIHILHRHWLELQPDDALRVDACLATASQSVDEIERLAETGPLPIMQDTGSCMTSSLVVFLKKIFRTSTRAQKSLIVSLLQRILMSHSRVSAGDDSMATAYVARFTRRILGAVGQESRAASPGILAPMDGTGNGSGGDHLIGGNGDYPGSQLPGNEGDFLAELEQFLQMPDNVIENESKDQEYWAMLFSADPTNNTYIQPANNGVMPTFFGYGGT